LAENPTDNLLENNPGLRTLVLNSLEHQIHIVDGRVEYGKGSKIIFGEKPTLDPLSGSKLSNGSRSLVESKNPEAANESKNPEPEVKYTWNYSIGLKASEIYNPKWIDLSYTNDYTNDIKVRRLEDIKISFDKEPAIWAGGGWLFPQSGGKVEGGIYSFAKDMDSKKEPGYL
jgi:hypothetical protein